MVGVSGLDLCLPDCSWVENKVIDLYPYDAGTDSGITYMVRTQQFGRRRDLPQYVRPDMWTCQLRQITKRRAVCRLIARQ